MEYELHDWNPPATATIAWLWQSGASEWWPLALVGITIVGGIAVYLVLTAAHGREVALLREQIDVWQRIAEKATKVAERKVTVNARRELSAALLDAFRSKHSLANMLRLEIGVNLAEVSGAEDLQTMVLDVMDWAESQGRAAELLAGACRNNPGNEKLKEYARLYGTEGQ